MAQGPYEIRITMTAEQAVGLLQGLAEDPGFQDEFVSDTQGVLGRFGIEISEDLIPSPVVAPKPEAAAAALRAIREMQADPEMREPYGPPWSPPPYARVEPYKPYGSAFLMLFSFIFNAVHREARGKSQA